MTEELYLTPTGSVARAKRLDDEHGVYVVKRFSPPMDDPSEPHWEHAIFLDRARAQQQLVAGGARFWAPIHQVGVSDSGAWFATDYLPLSAQKLLDGKVELKPAALYSIVTAVVHGLTELRNARGRAHGNLKPSNILFAGKDLTSARVLLTDLGSPAQAAKAGEPGDLYALGLLLYELVMHHPYGEQVGWPLTEESQWDKLGESSPVWRQLCSDLLVPVAALRPPLSAVTRRLEPLAPKEPKRRLRPMLVAAMVPLAIAFAAVVILSMLDHSARREFSRSRQEWFGSFLSALNNPARRQLYSTDPTLQQIIAEVDHAHVAEIQPDAHRLLSFSLSDYHALRTANATVKQVQAQLEPDHWQRLSQAIALKERFETLAWPQPVDYLSKLISAAQPAPGTQVAQGIDRLITVLPKIERQLPTAEENWKSLVLRSKEIQAKNDKVLNSMGLYLRSSAAAGIELSDAGLSGFDQVSQNARLAERVADAVRTDFPKNVDREHLNKDVADSIDLDRLRRRDVEQYLHLLALNTVRTDETQAAVASLKKRLDETLDLVNRSHPDDKEQQALTKEQSLALSAIGDFGKASFTARTMADGTFSARRLEVESKIDSLRKYYHAEGPEDWLKTLPVLSTSSERINAYWEAWRRLLHDSIDEMTRDRQVFTAYQQRAGRLRELLTSLDHNFPPAPSGLNEAFAGAAHRRREEVIEKLLPLIDPSSAKLDPATLKASQQAYAQWSTNLLALSKDFPIRKEILLLDDRPDKKWLSNFGFWGDAAIQALVKADVARIDRLQALRTLPRAELAKTAAQAPEPEVILACWQLLGSQQMIPAWPGKPGELTAELGIRNRLAAALKDLPAREVDPIAATLRDQGSARWKRVVENATSEALLAEAIKDQRGFGISTGDLDSLSAPARHNLWTYALKQGIARNSDEIVRDAVDHLHKAASDLKDRPEEAALLASLSRLDAKEPFAEQNPSDRFRISIASTQPQVEFKRVEPKEGRPFYLATAEVSFQQFASVIQASNAWGEVKKLPWAYASGQRDARRGPRVWEWAEQFPVPMSSPQYWLTPDDDNDFPAAFRAGRFNRMVLAEQYGGPPEPEHPMQQISAQAALYYAALCGCRLPSAREWQSAYDQFEKAGTTEQWNLRDQTFEQQRKYLSQNATNHSLVDGVFVAGDRKAAADAKALGYNDNTLYFRHVSAPGSGSIFRNLVGNVAEFVCDASGQFDALAPEQKKTAGGIRSFVQQAPDSLFVIGGSALSPPDVPPTRPLPVTRSDQGYADVGLRLAFTAPSRSYAERVKWVVGDVQYMWPTTTGKKGND